MIGMTKVKLGKTDLWVNPIGLGTNAVGGHNLYPNLDEQVGIDLVKAAINHDMNFIDTAFIYGIGRSEELVGQAIKETGKRSEVVLATKGAQRIVDGKVEIDNSPEFMKQSVEASLKRLDTDYIDLYYIHNPDGKTPLYEAVGALQELKDAGKIRGIGTSNLTPAQLEEANKDGYVDVFQGEYNLLARGAENDFFPYTLEHNIAFIPFFPLAAGILAGKYNKNTKFPADDLRHNMPHLQGEAFVQNLEKVVVLRNIANEKGAEVASIVLAWYLTQDAITAVIPGAKNPEQVLKNQKTLDVTLTEDEIEEINRVFS